jgi:hypothetical protein
MKGAQTNRQAENRATAAAAVVVDNSAPMKGRPVEVPVAGLDQRVCVNAIVQRSQRAGRRDLEDRPARCPVEVAIAGLDERCAGISAVRVVEAVQCGQRAGWGDFEDRATGASVTTGIFVSPARVSRPIE